MKQLSKPIYLCCLGSRGDLQPFLALGVGLRAAGLPVVLASSDNERCLVESYGVPFTPLGVDMSEIMKLPVVRQLSRDPSPWSFLRKRPSELGELREQAFRVQTRLWELCQQAGAVVYHPGQQNLSIMCRQLSIPSIMATPFPLTQTRNYRSILFYRRAGGYAWLNLASHLVLQQSLWMMGRTASVRFRRSRQPDLAVPWLAPSLSFLSRQTPVIHLYSTHFFPPSKDWPQSQFMAGSYDLAPPTGWSAPADLKAFLEEGAPPVYMGFGSMETDSDGPGVELSGYRVIKYHPRARGRVSQSCFETGSLPHSWLFPQVKAIVHHGGAGTTSSALRAGKPSVVVPHMADQPGWAARLQELGCASKPLPLRQWNVRNLQAALDDCLKAETVERARALGQKLCAEDGIVASVGFIKSVTTSSAETH
jgi:sterol 3beta-glucosyltransferase